MKRSQILGAMTYTSTMIPAQTCIANSCLNPVVFSQLVLAITRIQNPIQCEICFIHRQHSAVKRWKGELPPQQPRVQLTSTRITQWLLHSSNMAHMERMQQLNIQHPHYRSKGNFGKRKLPAVSVALSFYVLGKDISQQSTSTLRNAKAGGHNGIIQNVFKHSTFSIPLHSTRQSNMLM